MKAVIGLLLVFLGLFIGYMVLTGRLPSAAASPGTSGLPTEVRTPTAGFQASSGQNGI